MAKIAEEWVRDGDKLVHIKKQDWNPMLDRAEELRQHGNAEFGDFPVLLLLLLALSYFFDFWLLQLRRLLFSRWTVLSSFCLHSGVSSSS